MKTRRHVRLTERVSLGTSPAHAGSRVDRERKVIRDVKVLGLRSANGRLYTKEAIREAISLYEGAKVKANHPRRPGDTRDVDDTLGWFEGIYEAEDGLYAREFHYLESHPLSARVCEAAERNPRLFGFSHNIQGDTEERRDGTELVRRITEVRSVDLVDEPATTGGLFEGRFMRLRKFLEALKPCKSKAGRAALRRLFEANVIDAETEMPGGEMAPDEDAPDEDHEGALRDGFEASCLALIRKCLRGEADCNESLKKLKELLTSHGKLSGGKGDDVEEEDDTDEKGKDVEECEDDEKDKKAMKEELATLRKERQGRRLCEEAGVQADSVLLEALAGLPDEAAMKRLIEREKARPAGRPGQAPRSGSGGGGKTEGRNGRQAEEDDVGDFIGAFRR